MNKATKDSGPKRESKENDSHKESNPNDKQFKFQFQNQTQSETHNGTQSQTQSQSQTQTEITNGFQSQTQSQSQTQTKSDTEPGSQSQTQTQSQDDDSDNDEVSLGKMKGKSKEIKDVFSVISKVSASDSNVLLAGESGTGKEMVAREIHQQSKRRDKPFVAINCSAIPEHLLESELFGHKKGAFTGATESRKGLFEEANGGTIFLDEIGDMPFALQSKLLRVIQDRNVTPVGENKSHHIDVRIIAATHMNLSSMVSEGTFREDLFYRLSVIPIQIPPLRKRKEDIPLLAEVFLNKFCKENHLENKKFSFSAMTKLVSQGWPGNVRELENSIERAVVLSDKELIDDSDIQTTPVSPKKEDAPEGIFAKLFPLEEIEKCYILYVLSKTGTHKDKAAKILGINRKTLYRKEIEYGLTNKSENEED